MIGRRRFLKALGLFAVLAPGQVRQAFAGLPVERTLSLYNVHTGESLKTTYFADGKYDQGALNDLGRLLRCHHTGEVAHIATDVLDLLHDVTVKTSWKGQIAIISGYRSPSYNALLLDNGRRVVRDSLHLEGKAIDFSLKGVGTRTLAGIARSFLAGGVGRYASFVHIDVGRVRYW